MQVSKPSLEKRFIPSINLQRVINSQGKKQTQNVKLFCATKKMSSVSLQKNGHVQAKTCLSHIKDPLWKNICMDFLHMMGPVSLLMIWENTLGEFLLQGQEMKITCKNKETAAFTQQYDFVILGSLQKYFPTLKKLKINTE